MQIFLPDGCQGRSPAAEKKSFGRALIARLNIMNGGSPLRPIWLLLLVPYLGLLWVPFYNARAPELWGFPFFYWYQLIWVPITAALTWLVYRSVHHDE
jgi:hypothetical protein